MTTKGTPGKRPRGEKKKAETIRKRQEAQKQRLLEVLEKSPNIGYALSHVGINRSTLSRWREADLQFRLDVDHAIELGIATTADMVEGSLLESAKRGEVQAQKYYLNNNHERYRTNKSVQENSNPLTEERKKQIADAGRAWDVTLADYPNERDEDYMSPDNPE